MDSCPNCGKTIKGGLFANELVTENITRINRTLGKACEAYCTSCFHEEDARASDVLYHHREKIKAEREALLEQACEYASHVPVVSLQMPQGWDYKPLSIVTSQSVTGTGLFSSFAASFTDVLGLQSGAFRTKILEGETLCKRALQVEALKAGGNAVMGVDIDYAEVGGTTAMLMVCMTGTAVQLENLSILPSHSRDALEKASALIERMSTIS